MSDYKMTIYVGLRNITQSKDNILFRIDVGASGSRLLSCRLQQPRIVGSQTSVNGWNSQVSAALILRHDADNDFFLDSSVISDLR